MDRLFRHAIHLKRWSEFPRPPLTPPFHVTERDERRQELDPTTYTDHRDSGTGMPLAGWAGNDLVGTTTQRSVSRLNIQILDGLIVTDKFVGLMFNENASFIHLYRLDRLLEQCLAAIYYLRFAVIPVKMAQALMLQGKHARAIQHLKLVYDDHSTSERLRDIYPHLTRMENVFTQTAGADQRLMRLRLGDAYLKQAEQLFRKNTAESKHQAHRLFKRVLALHNQKDRCECDGKLGDVVETVLKRGFGESAIVNQTAITSIIELSSNAYQNAYGIDAAEIVQEAFEGATAETFDRAIELSEEKIANARAKHRQTISQRTTIKRLRASAQALIEEAEIRLHQIGRQQFNDATMQVNRLNNNVYQDSRPLFDFLDISLCIPVNPIVLEQTKEACLKLDMLKNCLNVLGYREDFIPAHRFEYLFALAGEFTNSAHSAERDVLRFTQALDQNVQQSLQSENNVIVGELNVGLEELNVEYALGDISLLGLQKSQAEFARAHYDQLIANGLSGHEQLALGAAAGSTAFSGIAAAGGIISAGVAAVGTASSASGSPVGLAMAAGGIAGTVLGGAQGIANFANSVSNLASIQSSFERRAQEWHYNRGLNQIAVETAEWNVAQGFKRFDIVQRQRELAQLRLGFARDTLNYLEHKLLDNEMLAWMLRLSRQQYRLRLDYAISAAFMAERALSFELLSRATQMIRFDYYNSEREGHLGATQLQTDLRALQKAKLRSEKRKLQLRKTLSLAQLAPAELQKFKTSGILPFSTVLGWFDRDFPGHYQRTIKRVSVSMLALVPPREGIKAMLRNTGVSNVVTGPPYNDGFEKVTVSRNPESIALTSAIDDSGIIHLDFQGEFLLPFQGLGVETDWLLEMPLASNPLDFETIADIYINIDYTALQSDLYSAQVRESLGDTDEVDFPIQFRIHYPDEWYHFWNDPLDDQGQRSLNVELALRKFSTHYDVEHHIGVLHIAVMLRGDFSALNATQLEKLGKSVTVNHSFGNDGTPQVLTVSNGPSPGPTPFKLIEVSSDKKTLLLSTRDSSDGAARLPSDITAIGAWQVSIKDGLGGDVNAGDLVNDVLLLITTEGKVKR